MIGRPSWYLRFCVHTAYVEGTAPTDLGAQPWTRGAAIVQQRMWDQLQADGVPPELVVDRWNLATGLLTHALADRELLLQHSPQRVTTPRAVLLAHLIDAAVAVTGAAVSQQTSHQINHQINDRRSA